MSVFNIFALADEGRSLVVLERSPGIRGGGGGGGGGGSCVGGVGWGGGC